MVVLGGGGGVAFDRLTGQILSVRESSYGIGSIAETRSGGNLWSLKLRSGQALTAADCLKNAPLQMKWLGPEHLQFIYSAGSGGTVTADVSGSSLGVDLRLSVRGLPDDVLSAALPDDLSFQPHALRRVLFPEHLGIALKPSFYEAHPQPMSWTPAEDGPQGLQTVAGVTCKMPPLDQPAASVHATDLGQQVLGAQLAAAWEAAPQAVSRAPEQEPQAMLLNSDDGAFLGGHVVGQGLLMRFGGWPSSSAQPLIVPTLAHIAAALSQSRGLLGIASPTGARTRIVVIQPKYLPSGGAVEQLTADALQTELAGAHGLQVVAAETPDQLQATLADARTLAVVNPSGEAFLAGDNWRGMLNAVHAYLVAGGAWIETGGYSFYYHLQSNRYASLADNYPSRSFCDFARIEGLNGALSLYGVQSSLDKALVFTPGAWRTFGDSSGGHLHREWQTFLPKSGGETPTVRLRMSDPDAGAALSEYARANGIERSLASKMSPRVLKLWKQSLTIKLVTSTVGEETGMLDRLPSPAILHEVSYLHGGFDRQYPDHLPPKLSYGTPDEFRAFLAQAHARGDLVMPYTNTTWWPDNPKGPTFQQAGDAPLLVNLDGSHNHEVYGAGSSGWSITPFHPAVTASVDRLLAQFTREYPMDIVFGDQNGARGMMYDLNPFEPTPYAYTQGMIDLAGRAAAKFPVATEDGFDRLVNVESEFCGLTQEIVPFPYDQSQLLSNRLPDADWEFFPMAQSVAHDKAFFMHHDLGAGVWNEDALLWSLALGYGLSDAVAASDLDNPAKRQWLEHLARLQSRLGPIYMGAPLLSFHYLQGSGSRGVIEAVYGRMRVIVNLTDSVYAVGSVSVPAHAFRAQAGSMLVLSTAMGG